MLVAGVFHYLHEAGPLFATFFYKVKKQQALFSLPISLDLRRVKVIIPSLPALFSSSEVFFFRTMKQQFRNFIPFGGMISISKLTFEVLNNLFEQFLLFFSPNPTFTALTNRMALVLKQFGVFMVEHGGKKLPVLLSLREPKNTKCSMMVEWR